VKAHRERKYSRFIDGFIGDARYFYSILAHVLHVLNRLYVCKYVLYCLLHLIAKKLYIRGRSKLKTESGRAE